MKLVKYFVIKGMLLMMVSTEKTDVSEKIISIPLEQKQELDKLFG